MPETGPRGIRRSTENSIPVSWDSGIRDYVRGIIVPNLSGLSQMIGGLFIARLSETDLLVGSSLPESRRIGIKPAAAQDS